MDTELPLFVLGFAIPAIDRFASKFNMLGVAPTYSLPPELKTTGF
ncbi:hypothetical protein PPEP_b0011 [Pseudoalteromonas peptidolytica F12-50-A1]|uniref:Uncharacterized protein n=1 Tax=Pseudoalteromonas peptidolytica F12-50-A1 TaxID=1315280 RepID=A0A8I0T5C2_9GAMM|nr:hypothetical protein [Pseudoalteromonas peptidolytica F12-50-A1]